MWPGDGGVPEGEAAEAGEAPGRSTLALLHRGGGGGGGGGRFGLRGLGLGKGLGFRA